MNSKLAKKLRKIFPTVRQPRQYVRDPNTGVIYATSTRREYQDAKKQGGQS